MQRTVNLSAIVVGMVVLAGCNSTQSTAQPEATVQPMATTDLSAVNAIVTVYPVEATLPIPTSFPAGTQSFDPIVEGVVSLVKNDLIREIGTSLERINVISVESVEWPDASLGCGEPGTEYPQVITPGFIIMLEADSQIYSYHTNISDQFILCAQRPPARINLTP